MASFPVAFFPRREKFKVLVLTSNLIFVCAMFRLYYIEPCVHIRGKTQKLKAALADQREITH